MSEWLYVKHPETGGQTRVPDQPGVRDRYEALGWEVVDSPDEDAGIFIPPKAVAANEDDGWVDLYHPVTHATHRFPSHPDAVQGAYEAGWQATKPKGFDDASAVDVAEAADTDETDDAPDPDPEPSPAVKKTAPKKVAEPTETLGE